MNFELVQMRKLTDFDRKCPIWVGPPTIWNVVDVYVVRGGHIFSNRCSEICSFYKIVPQPQNKPKLPCGS